MVENECFQALGQMGTKKPIAWVISHLWSENSPVNYNSQTAKIEF